MLTGPVRVWLEPGYDGGRVGAWLLDLPGCFTWGRTRPAAIGRAPSAVARFVAWLGDHGASIELPELDETVVVEEVPATIDGDGYERNALFEADHRAVSQEELETAIQRLEYARSDLLAIHGRLRRLDQGQAIPDERETRADEPDQGRPERPATEVLRHVAEAEAWLASRLDPGPRYEGPPRKGDPFAFLDATRSWAVARIREQHGRDPAPAWVDGKGEGWTLAKVVRRLLYHGIDHLEELDQRLALAEGRLERVNVVRNARVDPSELAVLLRNAGLHAGRRSPQQVGRMLAATRESVSAWDEDRLIGFARAITDGVTNAYVSSVAVDARWQDRGLGRRLIEALIDGREGMKFVLTAREGTEDFYRRLGFKPDERVLVRQRRRPESIR
ncbi:MAG TPA: GNAT family N-acetyltransferase [Candidatus Limnocylindrales bacterium]|nr:GNAT family N-acetyltransferase [Candidatus Limnocylindrales bacterium]